MNLFDESFETLKHFVNFSEEGEKGVRFRRSSEAEDRSPILVLRVALRRPSSAGKHYKYS